jgi:hypothetical protein
VVHCCEEESDAEEPGRHIVNKKFKKCSEFLRTDDSGSGVEIRKCG